MFRDFSASIRTPVGASLRWVSPAEAMTQTETCEGESVILSFLLSAA